MYGFSYYNIFETKGIEYLAIIAFFVMLIPFWIMLNKQVKVNKQLKAKLGTLTHKMLNIPQGLFYSRNHTWTHLEKSGLAKIGLDDMLLHLTGDVKLEFHKKPGESLQKGEIFATISQNGKQLSVASPVSGEIISSNSVIKQNPELLNQDPYNKGWVYKVRPLKWVDETNTYYLAEEATTWSQKELERFKDFLANSMAKYSADPSRVILQDGGEVRDQPLSGLPAEIWNDFQLNFMELKV